jgi:hypothetical protein
VVKLVGVLSIALVEGLVAAASEARGGRSWRKTMSVILKGGVTASELSSLSTSNSRRHHRH